MYIYAAWLDGGRPLCWYGALPGAAAGLRVHKLEILHAHQHYIYVYVCTSTPLIPGSCVINTRLCRLYVDGHFGY